MEPSQEFKTTTDTHSINRNKKFDIKYKLLYNLYFTFYKMIKYKNIIHNETNNIFLYIFISCNLSFNYILFI
jgi:hypothetical protein